MRINSLANILFDLDGTLTDPKEGITRCIRFALGQLDAPLVREDRLIWCIGPPLRESFEILLNTSDATLLDRALFFYRKRFAEIGMFENALYPGIVPALQNINNAGFRIFLATSKPRVYALQILEYFELTHFFHAVHGSELDGRLTDKGALIAHILSAGNLDPSNTLIVGDRSHDIIGGKKNRIMTAAVTYGYGSEEEIAEAHADVVFESPAAMAGFLVARFASSNTKPVRNY